MKTKAEIIEYLKTAGINVPEKVRMVVKDHKGNPLAPERYCYKVYLNDNGVKRRFAIWPETVGYQGF